MELIPVCRNMFTPSHVENSKESLEPFQSYEMQCKGVQHFASKTSIPKIIHLSANDVASLHYTCESDENCSKYDEGIKK